MCLSYILAFEGDRSVMLWISYCALWRRVKTKNRSTATSSSGGAGAQIHMLQGVHFCQTGSKPQPKPTCAPCSTSRGRGARCASPRIGSCARIPSGTGGGAGSGGSSGARELPGSDRSVSLRIPLRKSLTLSSGAPWLRSVRFLRILFRKLLMLSSGAPRLRPPHGGRAEQLILELEPKQLINYSASPILRSFNNSLFRAINCSAWS